MHKHLNRMSLALVIPIGVGLFWAASAAAQQCIDPPSVPPPPTVTIGDGASFAVLLDGPLPNNVHLKNNLSLGTNATISGPAGTIGAVFGDVLLGAGASVSGDIAVSMYTAFASPPAPPSASIALGGASTVKGKGVTDGGTATPVKSFKGGTSTDNTSPYVTDSGTADVGILGNAVNQEECFDGNVICQPDQQKVTVNVAPGSKQTLATTSPGLNVFVAPNINVSSLATLTIKGGKYDEVLLETPGAITLGPSSKILLAGGITAANVLITATTPPYNDPGATTNSQSRVNTGSGVTVNGTLHGEYGCTLGPNNTINGALVCDWTLNAGNGLHVNHIPLTMTLPSFAGADYFQCTAPGDPGEDDL
jgi:hypothetical protein